VRASTDENPDLYWGLRGGGGNFGVVTEFEFELHRTGTRAVSVELDFPVPGAAPAVAAWRDLAATAPRAATYAALVTGGVVTLGFVWVGEPDAGREHARALAALGRPSAERLVELSYLELQSRDDTTRGHTFRSYVKGHYLGELSDAAIEAFLAHDSQVGASLQAYGGAIADVPDDATAFSHRATAFEYVAATRWSDPAEDEGRKALVREGAARIGVLASGVYVNTLSDDGLNGVQRAYPPAKLARLRALKDHWDPDNIFHLNPNIAPSPTT
jgi:FAD/FMN-containing dehydrogenase